MEALIRQIYAQAKLLGACSLFTGRERTVEDIITLFTSPQGIEFCKKYHFPSMTVFRMFKTHNVEKYGIYIDAGAITLKNPENVVLIGHTSATVFCDKLTRHEITLFRGARAIVNASKWAVVHMRAEQGCCFIKNTSDNAIII